MEGDLDAIALNDLLNELRNAGAEAMAVDQIRITARSVAVQGPTALLVDGVPVGRRFTLRAIGSPEGLLSTIERPGGIIPQLEQFIDASIVASQSDDLDAARHPGRPDAAGRAAGRLRNAAPMTATSVA